ncbi:MAG: thioesterase [Acidobacteriia bacterium]|nr:thioesterase [Terriglobia bacterium]
MSVDPWLPYWRPAPQARVRLICFPYAGGGASVFERWRADFPREIEICGVQLPGREGRLTERCFTRMDPLADRLADILSRYSDAPLAFFGHSLGALIAWETARRLAGHGSLLKHLFVSGQRAPHLPGDGRMTHLWPDAEFKDELRRLNGTPGDLLENEELMQLVLPLLRADIGISESYVEQKREKLTCPISAFGALEDDVPPEQLTAWAECTTNRFQLRMMAGDHFYFRASRQPLTGAIIADLRSQE